MTAHTTAVTLPPSVLDKLQQEIDILPNALARIAKYMLEHPEKVIHQSIAELGDFSGSGEASILRLCRQLGFKGFRDFKTSLAMEVGRPPVESSLDADDRYSSLRDAICENTSIAHRQADSAAIANVAQVLRASRRIDIYGAGMSGMTAEMLAYRLLRVGLPALVFRDAHIGHEVAHGLGKDCAAVAFSISGLTRETCQFLKGARAAGARTIAITNRAQGPVSEAAEFTLHAAGLRDRPIGGTLGPLVPNIFLIESVMLEIGA